MTPALAVGGFIAPGLVPTLARELGVGSVVDLRVEACDDVEMLRAHGITLLHLPTEDKCAVAERDLDAGVAWVRAAIALGERVLVHCQHGIGRSALLCACVLVADGATPKGALAQLKRARALVSPSPVQLEALVSWSARRGAPATSWRDLAEIAYR